MVSVAVQSVWNNGALPSSGSALGCHTTCAMILLPPPVWNCSCLRPNPRSPWSLKCINRLTCVGLFDILSGRDLGRFNLRLVLNAFKCIKFSGGTPGAAHIFYKLQSKCCGGSGCTEGPRIRTDPQGWDIFLATRKELNAHLSLLLMGAGCSAHSQEHPYHVNLALGIQLLTAPCPPSSTEPWWNVYQVLQNNYCC